MRLLLFLSLTLIAEAQPYISRVVGGNLRPLAPVAELAFPFGSLTQDHSGNLYICGGHDVIRRMRADGMTEIIAGTGESGYSGDGGPALSAKLDHPGFCQFDSRGNLLFAEFYRIRRIDASGMITTIAGTGEGVQQNDPESTPKIGLIYGLTLDAADNLYIAEMAPNASGSTTGRIRRITSGGTIQTVAAPLQSPMFLAGGKDGSIYFSDGPVIRRLASDGTVSLVAGTGTQSLQVGTGDGGPAVTATLGNILGLTVDPKGEIYLVESAQFRARIRRIDVNGTIAGVAGVATGNGSETGAPLETILTTAASPMIDDQGVLWFTSNVSQLLQLKNGVIRVVGGANPRSAPDGMAARDAWLVSPTAAAVNSEGEIFISDAGCTIRKVGLDGILRTVPGTGNCANFPFSSNSLAATKDTIYMSQGSAVWSLKNGVGQRIENLPGGQLAVDSRGQLYVLTTGGQVWRWPTSGVPELYVGNSLNSVIRGVTLGLTRAIAIDPWDNLYIRQIPPSSSPISVSTYVISSTGEVSRRDSVLPDYQSPVSLTITSNGGVWETSNSSGIYSAFPAVTANPGYAGNDGPLNGARFSGPVVIAPPDGSVLVFERSNACIRRIAGLGMTPAPAVSRSGIVNAGSLLGGPVAPGELISIFGTGLGPLWPASFAIRDGKIPASLATVQVLFDGLAAPIAAISANQINVFVPFRVAGQANTSVVVRVDNQETAPVSVPVAPSAFGLFTANASGSGRAAALNEDYSYNTATVPALPGSTVSLYGTGVGAMTPVSEDGTITGTPLPLPALPVTVKIAGIDAEVQYAGAAPSLPAGVVQINVRVPAGVPGGDVPALVSVGGTPTTRAVIVSVR